MNVMKNATIDKVFWGLLCSLVVIGLSSFSRGETVQYFEDTSSKVEVTSISIGSKDKLGRYSVTIKVKATNLAPGESVKMIGAKWGTVKSHPNYRDSRSGVSSASFISAWHMGTTYYVTPFIKTNETSGEIEGVTVTKKTP